MQTQSESLTSNEVMKDVTPERIMQVGMGFFASKTLLTAVNLNLFTYLEENPLTGEEIKTKLGLHEQGLYDFMDSLVALGLLQRAGLKETSVYSNTKETSLFLDKNKPTYIGGILEMANSRMYKMWNDLEEGLKTAKPQSEIKHTGKSVFESLYESPEKLKVFINGMTGIQMGNIMTFVTSFDFSPYKTLCDIGGSAGHLAIQVAMHNPHIRCKTFDLPPIEPIAKETIESFNLSDRVEAVTGDFFKDDFPKADMITMGNILHDWNLEKKKLLIKKAYDALPEGGAFAVIENIIDDDRRQNSFGLFMSLHMLLEFGDAFDYTGADFTAWATEAGFKRTVILPLTGPASVAIAFK